MTPQEIVSELDRHIIGQQAAKRAVAIALRNRWRRQQVEPKLRPEITPKNILMIGPTGVGKTEIARRLAKLAHAPFIKVEATKFTEVGYVGKDVEPIIRDLADIAIKQQREPEMAKRAGVRAEDAAEERILDALVPPPRLGRLRLRRRAQAPADSAARQVFRKKLREGELDDKEIEIEVAAARPAARDHGPRPAWRRWPSSCRACSASSARGKKQGAQAHDRPRPAKPADRRGGRQAGQRGRGQAAGAAQCRAERHRLHRRDRQGRQPQRRRSGAEVSREGVQRDLLPLVEGTTVSTKYGTVKTDHILFIA